MFSSLAADAEGRVDEAAFAELLQRLVKLHPELVELRSLGHSRGGHDLPLLVISDRSAGEAARKSALCVLLDPRLGRLRPANGNDGLHALTSGKGDALFGTGAFLDELERWLAAPEREAPWLAQHALYVVPLPDPDLCLRRSAEHGPALAGVSYERDFPSGWDGERGSESEAGPYPLFRAECRALARWLRVNRNVCAAVYLSPASMFPALLEQDPLEHGSLGRFVTSEYGIALLAPYDPLDQALRASDAPTPLERALRALPRLSFAAPTVERLRTNLWQVEIALHNEGELGTGRVAPAPRADGEGLRLKVGAARLVSAAMRTMGAPGFEDLPPHPDGRSLGELEPRGELVLRLLLEANEGASATLEAGSARAGSVHTTITLVPARAGGI